MGPVIQVAEPLRGEDDGCGGRNAAFAQSPFR